MKFEDLVRVLEEEKKPTMSRIAPGFYSAVQEYIKELEEADQKISRRHSEESIMIQYELKNALSTVDKIFKKRIRKIIRMASGKAFSKNPTNIAHDIENMTPEERYVYQQVLDAILSGKKNTIETIFGTLTENEPGIKSDIKPEIKPDIKPEIKPDIEPEIKPEIKPDIEPDVTALVHDTNEHMVPAADNTPGTEKTSPQENETQVTSPPLNKEEMGNDPDETGKKDLNKEYIVVRLLKDIPKFRGADGRNYRLSAQDVAVLPKVNANPLIKRKVAVQIEST